MSAPADPPSPPSATPRLTGALGALPPADPDVWEERPAPEEERHPYLLFRICAGWYALPTQAVHQVVAAAAPVPVPLTPSFVRGVVSLGGRIVTVVDPVPLLLPPGAEASPEVAPRYVVVRAAVLPMALEVHETAGVAEVAPSELRADGRAADPVVLTSFVHRGRAVSVLDPGALLARAEARVREV